MTTLTSTKFPACFTTVLDYYRRNGMDERTLFWLNVSILLGILAAACCYPRLWRPSTVLLQYMMYQVLLPVVQFVWPAIRCFALAFGGICSLSVRALLFLCVDVPDAMSERMNRIRWRLRRDAGIFVPKKLKHVDLANREEVDTYWEVYAPKFDVNKSVTPRYGYGVTGTSDERCTLRHKLWLRPARAMVTRHHSRSKTC
ncbi:hypothetical protein ACRALDRAFT_2042838 [Sodiomyces alcalophilus JCM 7366]|uniref:uncharacterized protein n=1 Tax=Sodiomyces alcalophilus JCM 7366 TaxID=591952 RepID=UPI0039B384E4